MHFERTFCGTQHQVRVRTMRNMQTTRRSTHRAPASLKRTCIRMYASPKMPLSPQTKDKFICVCKRYSLSPSKEKVSQRCRESSRRQESNAFKKYNKTRTVQKRRRKEEACPTCFEERSVSERPPTKICGYETSALVKIRGPPLSVQQTFSVKLKSINSARNGAARLS